MIQQRIENALAGRILAGEIGDGDSVRVDYLGKSFTFTKVGGAVDGTVADALSGEGAGVGGGN